jgi:hypothetical protein
MTEGRMTEVRKLLKVDNCSELSEVGVVMSS